MPLELHHLVCLLMMLHAKKKENHSKSKNKHVTDGVGDFELGTTKRKLTRKCLNFVLLVYVLSITVIP